MTHPIAPADFYGCTLWQGPKDRDGYGRVGSKRGKLAHRVVYQEEHGPVADGLVLDHLCRRRSCVNPDHLEPVTEHENQKRKLWKYRCKRRVCPKGHSLAHAVKTPEAGVLCRVCRDVARGLL